MIRPSTGQRTAGELAAEPVAAGLRAFAVPAGIDIGERLADFVAWQDKLKHRGAWPYGLAIEDLSNSTCRLRTGDGVRRMLNFASQDYLGLSTHCKIKSAAADAVRRFGPQGAGPAARHGGTRYTRALERRLGAFLGMRHVLLCPSGWAAGYGAIRGLVRSADHVVIDQYSSAPLQEGANAATDKVYRYRHLSVDYCRKLLGSIRAGDSANGILVVTESVFPVDAESPDLAAMRALAREFDATLLVDVSHDLGCRGEHGRGQLDAQAMTGQLDLVVGSFSKAFATNGGFIACDMPAVREYLRFFGPPVAHSHAISPVQAAVALQALNIVQSEEGRDLRAALDANTRELRRQLREADFICTGEAAGIVSIKLDSEVELNGLCRRLSEFGLIADPCEYPLSRRQPHLRLFVTAHHCARNIREAVEIFRKAREAAEVEVCADAPPIIVAPRRLRIAA
jgi:glycine C-acetyltransferase